MKIKIPGHADYDLKYIVCDYNGTLAIDGVLIDGIGNLFNSLSKQGLRIFVITADTHGDAQKKLEGLPCETIILKSDRHDEEKGRFVESLSSENVIAFGNGKNDRIMLKKAAIGVAVLQEEGLCVETFNAADILVKDIRDGLSLLLYPQRLVASLRL